MVSVCPRGMRVGHGETALHCRVIMKKYVHTVQQKLSGMKFSKLRSGSDVSYNCHHNSSRYTFLLFVHSWLFSVCHSLQSVTAYILTKDTKTPIYLLNLKLKS